MAQTTPDVTFDADRHRLWTQGFVAAAVLGCATYLGAIDVLDSEAISVLFGAALGAVGAGGISARATPTTTQTFRNGTGEVTTTERKAPS